MNAGDAAFSPRPSGGKWVEWRKRKAAYWNGRYLEYVEKWFLTWDLGGTWHGYIGYPPININDDHFAWVDLPRIQQFIHDWSPELWVNWQFRPFGWGSW